MHRLSLATLGSIPAAVRRPAYAIERVTPGIVHLGVGNFHRAHQAMVVDDALAAGESNWGIVGISLRSPGMRDALAPQDYLYTVIERGDRGTPPRVIGAIREVLVAPVSPATVIDRISDPSIRIITLTVTEKGYGQDPTTGDLRSALPEIAHDLANANAPQSAIGFLAAGLHARYTQKRSGLTVLSCDNLTHNGNLVARLLAQFSDAAYRDPGFVHWIEENVRCPNAMVDRIVPATTGRDRAEAAQALGVEDAWPVATEPFTQWVIEDRFAAARPAWERSGVQFVDDVAPFEAMKLRLLNTAHSCLSYLGYPAGFETIPAARGEPALREFIVNLWRREAVHTLPDKARAEMEPYCARLLDRFSNVALGHRTRQIAQDGSQKLPMRLVPMLRALAAQGRPFHHMAMGVAAWIRYLRGVTEQGGKYSIEDPMAERLSATITKTGDDPEALVHAMLSIETVFGPDLALNRAVTAMVTRYVAMLMQEGSVAALGRLQSEIRSCSP
jgi:fructuronate reductase